MENFEGIEYKNVFDLPTLNTYYMQEFDRILMNDGLFKGFKFKIIRKITKRYFTDFKALPECRFMFKSKRRKMFEEHRKLLTVYIEQSQDKTVEFQNGNNLPTIKQ